MYREGLRNDMSRVKHEVRARPYTLISDYDSKVVCIFRMTRPGSKHGFCGSIPQIPNLKLSETQTLKTLEFQVEVEDMTMEGGGMLEGDNSIAEIMLRSINLEREQRERSAFPMVGSPNVSPIVMARGQVSLLPCHKCHGPCIYA